MSHYEVKAGPEAFLPPAAATMGNVLPDPGEAHIGGKIVPEEEAYEHAARKILGAKVPTIFPGPLVLWKWNDHVAAKATAIREYPKIDAAVEINPNHPNLTIWHNKIDVCIFIGVHCHQANLALKMIRASTSCYTMAMCAMAGHEDACLSFRDADLEKIQRLTAAVKKLKAEGVKVQANSFTQFQMNRSGFVVEPVN
jgi:hypothetical protein